MCMYSLICECLCCETLLLGIVNKLQITPDREPRTDQSKDIMKIQLGEPLNFIGVISRSVVGLLFTGAEMTQRELYHKKPPKRSCITLKSCISLKKHFLFFLVLFSMNLFYIGTRKESIFPYIYIHLTYIQHLLLVKYFCLLILH